MHSVQKHVSERSYIKFNDTIKIVSRQGSGAKHLQNIRKKILKIRTTRVAIYKLLYDKR